MPWQVNVETAQQIAAKTNRLVLIHFWAPWCKPCMRLEKEVFSRADTAKSLEANFVFVKVNADEAPGTTRSFGVSSLPTDVIVTPQGRLVSQFQSPPTATQYITQLNQAAAGHRELARRSSQPAGPAAAAVAPAANTAVAPVVAPAAPAAASPAPAPVSSAAMPADPNVVASAPVATDRYAEYYRQQQLAQAGATPAAAAPAAMPPQAPAVQQPAAAPQPPEAALYAAAPTVDPSQQPPAAQQAPPAAQPPAVVQPQPVTQAQPAPQTPMAAQASPGGAGYPPQEAYNAHAAYQPSAQAPQLPPGCPPAALDGNCPVTLMERRQWATGNRAWGAIHRGRTYLFVGLDEK
jgi:thioredoxin-like negative regulator of GroEL